MGNVWVFGGVYLDSRPILFPLPNFRKKFFPIFSVVGGKRESLGPAKNWTHLRSGSLVGPRLFANFDARRRIDSRSGTPLCPVIQIFLEHTSQLIHLFTK